jgi:hypothetical protein
MQITHKPNSRSAKIEEESANEVIVAIAYDDLRAGQWAGRLFSSVAREEAGNLRFRLQPWRFDFLADPEWSRFAAAEAQQADLLVLAVTHSPNLPAAVQRWLNEWFDGKRGDHSALVVLIESDNDSLDSNSSTLQFLRHAAEEAGLDFFTPHAAQVNDMHNRLHVPQPFTCRRPYRHWGLNE